MISRERQRCLRILEVTPEATPEEITLAYNRLKRLHGKEPGLAMAGAMEEFSPEARAEVLDELEAAYALLRSQPPETAAAAPLAPPEPREEVLPTEASALRRARITAGLSLDQVAQDTCVRLEYLKALEAERFEDLRLATVNVRGYLTAFATAVSLPAEAIVPAYMARFQAWQNRR